MAAGNPEQLQKLQLALVADFLTANGLSGTMTALAGEVRRALSDGRRVCGTGATGRRRHLGVGAPCARQGLAHGQTGRKECVAPARVTEAKRAAPAPPPAAGEGTSVLELLVSYFFKPADLATVPTSPEQAAAAVGEGAEVAQHAPPPAGMAGAGGVVAAPTPGQEATPAPVVPVPAPAVPVVEPVAEAVAEPVAVPASTPAPAVPPPVTAPMPVPAPAPAPAPAAGKGGFWARLQAQKAAAEGAAASPAPAPEPATAAAAVAAAPAEAPAPTTGKGGFWARLQAQKAEGGGAAAAPEEPKEAVAETFKWTAPDGKGFNDKHAYRRHMFATVYSFSKKTGETLVKLPGQVEGQQFGMSDLTGCTALLCDHSDTVLVDRCVDCTIFIAASSNSVFLRNCTNCRVTLACKQLRTRDLAGCTIFLYSKTDPVIEATTGLQLGEFNAACPGLEAAFAAANLQPENNHWRRVFDFHKGDGTYAMPHWTFLPEEQWSEWTIDLAEHGAEGAPVNPVQRGSRADPATVMEAGGIAQVGADAGQGGMQTFDITTTSAADALKATQA